jgi:hypothetical protein
MIKDEGEASSISGKYGLLLDFFPEALDEYLDEFLGVFLPPEESDFEGYRPKFLILNIFFNRY